jgi:hypothetical protein
LVTSLLTSFASGTHRQPKAYALQDLRFDENTIYDGNHDTLVNTLRQVEQSLTETANLIRKHAANRMPPEPHGPGTQEDDESISPQACPDGDLADGSGPLDGDHSEGGPAVRDLGPQIGLDGDKKRKGYSSG